MTFEEWDEKQMSDPEFRAAATELEPEYQVLRYRIRVLELEQKLSQLYVWRGVYTDYTPGVAFALAESAEQARQMIVDQVNYVDPGLAKVYDEPFAYHLYSGG